MTASQLEIEPIPAFSDNYIWLLVWGERECAVVDPGEAAPVERVLDERGLQLCAILVTHHHADHIGGIPTLRGRWPARVIGPDDNRIQTRTETVRHGDRVNIGDLSFDVLEVPGHTRSHVAFAGHGALFCGDTLFSAGCGRLFEGTPAQMQSSLDRLTALPPDTQVYCAHEYTQSNCDFALAVEPENRALLEFCDRVRADRQQGRCTLPSTLGEERQVNPFLRTREPAVVKAARHIDPEALAGEATLATIRAWKDRF